METKPAACAGARQPSRCCGRKDCKSGANHDCHGRQAEGKISAGRDRRVQQAPLRLLQAAGDRGERREGPGRAESHRDGAGEAERGGAHPGPAQARPVRHCAGDRRPDVVLREALRRARPPRHLRPQPGGVCHRRFAGAVSGGAEAG